MRKIMLGAVALALWLGVSATALAQKPSKPTVVIRLKSLDGLASDARYLAAQAGKAEEAKQIEGFLKAFTGEKGLDGLDTTKPMGLYLNLGPNLIDSEGVLLIPVKGQKSLLTTITRLGINPDKEKDGTFVVTPEGSPVPVYFRFVKGYAYVTVRDKEAISDKKLVAADKVLSDGNAVTAEIDFNLGGVPDEIREMVTGQAARMFADLKEKGSDGETEAQKKFRIAALDEAAGFVKDLVKGADVFSIKLDVDQKAGDVSFTLDLDAKDNSELAKMIAEVGTNRSPVTGVLTKDAAAQGSLYVGLPKSLHATYVKVLEEAKTSFMKQIAEDTFAQRYAPKLIEAAMPTLKNAELDLAVNFAGPSKDGKYTLIAGAAIRNGQGVEKALKDVWGDLPAEIKQALENFIKIDAAKVGKVNVHRLMVESQLDEDAERIFGKSSLYFAIRDDAVLFCMGDNALETLKQAISSESASAVPFRMEISLAHFAPLMAKDQPEIAKLAKKIFKDGKGDRISVTLAGGKSLSLRFAMDAKLLELAVAATEQQGGGAEQ